MLGLVGALALAGSALAQARDRAVGRWVHGVESTLHVLHAIAPSPPPPAAAAPTTPPVRTRAHRPALAGRAGETATLAPDERLDQVRAAFCPEAARLLCRARQRCGCVYDVPDCEADLEQQCTEELYAAFEESAETRELDPGVLARCLDGFADLPTHCQLPSAIVHGCAWPLRDQAARGEPCESDGACRGGLCDAEGTCGAPPAEGEPSRSDRCALELVSIDGRCESQGGLGARCTHFLQCGDGIFDCTEGRCVPRPQAGSSCSDSAECDARLACIDHECQPAPTWCDYDTDCGSEQECTRPPTGCAPCPPDMQCDGLARCDDGETCGAGLRCVDPSPSGRCGPQLCRMSRLRGVFDDLP